MNKIINYLVIPLVIEIRKMLFLKWNINVINVFALNWNDLEKELKELIEIK